MDVLHARLHPRDATAGGDGDGSSSTQGQAGFQTPSPGLGDTREEPKAGELARQDRAGT